VASNRESLAKATVTELKHLGEVEDEVAEECVKDSRPSFYAKKTGRAN
jgi:hypothetical protein